MKNLKKYLSFTMALIIAVAAFASLSVGAADAADPLDANLVIHYDFEGADVLAAVDDKATAGTVKDTLAPKAGGFNYAGIEIDSTNGTAKNTAGGAGLVATVSDDVKLLAGASTWFARCKFEPSASSNYYYIVDMRAFGESTVTRPFCLLFQPTTNKLIASFATAEEATKGINLNMEYAYDYEKAEYLNVAVAVEKTDAAMKVSVYVSTGLAKAASDWTLLGSKDYASVAEPTEVNNVNIFTQNTGSTGCIAGMTIDDIRLYNKTLTLDEIATIIPNGSFDGQLKSKPADTQAPETQAPETQAPETQTPETQAPETNAPETNSPETNSPDTEAPAKSGCGATVSMGALAIVAVVGAAVISKKKYN